ncbi:MAG: nickel-dependent hydrogenase large subunit, partial [Phycisphaeraceae bacterium]|nr:nickel-dependent hydrogenase large subunit [Phycisphaeraceae bacterium]
DITARICGICPVAYQMSSCHALEKALGLFDRIDAPIQSMRDLLYCGEWIESHVLHMFMLHLPDFLGYESALSMTEDHGDVVRSALSVKAAGNGLIEAIGGRSVHPVGACVGGFYKTLSKQQVEELLGRLRPALETMCGLTVQLAETVEFPRLERDYECMALQQAGTYAMNRGHIVTDRGLSVEPEEFLDVVEEKQVPHSNAFHAVIKGRGGYLVGPVARVNLNHAFLHPRALELLPKVTEKAGRPLPWRDNHLSLMARALEVVHALARAIDILEAHDPKDPVRVAAEPKAGTGAHATEAPRGLLWHQYSLDGRGAVTDARIIPPTSQNQWTIEQDLRLAAEAAMELDDQQATLECERVIRNYDPCISCSVHFLRFSRSWDNSGGKTA